MKQYLHSEQLQKAMVLKTNINTFYKLFIIFFLCIGSTVSATDVYLTNGNKGLANGTSFANGLDAGTYLATLLTTSPATGTHIYITGSVSYTIGTNFRSIVLDNNDIIIKGGYNPIAPYNYDPTAYVTTFSGFTGSNGAHIPMFTSSNMLSKTITIQGLKLINGFTNNHIFGNNDTFYASNYSGKFIFKDISITAQTFSQGLFFTQGFSNTGGTGSLTLENCYFANNTSTTGGGIIYDYSHNGTTQIPVTISNCSFKSNTGGNSGSDGGAIWVTANSGYTITNTSFCDNFSNRYGGALAMSHASSTLQMTGCNFSINHANLILGSGGAVFFEAHASATITNTNFYNNYVGGSLSSGGAIAQNNTNNSNVTIDGCLFYGNLANSATNSFGGAISTSTSVNGANTPTYTISNSIFSNNKAGDYSRGGAIYYANVSTGNRLVLNSNVFYNNTATTNTINGADINAAFGSATRGMITGSNNTVQNASGSYLSNPNNNSALPFTWTSTIYNNNTLGTGSGVSNSYSCPTTICNVITMTPIFN